LREKPSAPDGKDARRAAVCDNEKKRNPIRFPAAARVPPGDGRINAMLDNLFTPTHLIIILVIALLVFGPSNQPEHGKGLGEGLKGFKEGNKGISGNNDAAPQQQQQTIAKVDAPQQPPATTQVK
jgi:sec-independent protein translocase protein TatA